MSGGIALAPIPSSRYAAYRREAIFKAYKWDPQAGDQNTVAAQVLLLDAHTAEILAVRAEQLAQETALMEDTLAGNLPLGKALGLPDRIFKAIARYPKCGAAYDPARQVRLMRFDFHPVSGGSDGWAVSEVNSDVPGGLAEASVLPQIAAAYIPGASPGPNVADSLCTAFKKLTGTGRVAFVHATSYADDRQVMQFLGDYFETRGLGAVYAAPDHLRWANGQAYSIVEGMEGEIGGVFRFYPCEWFVNLPRSSGWEGYFNSSVVSCNHPRAMLSQSKRLPLVWNKLNVEIPAWKSLLPETTDVRTVRGDDPGWVYKPALGRVGEGIAIAGATPERERLRIQKAARRSPGDWVAQRRFDSRPVTTETGESFHVCVGVFTVNGRCAGFYGRISSYPHIDAYARDIPVLVRSAAAGCLGFTGI